MNDFRNRIKVDIPENKLSDLEARRVYEQFVSSQQQQFLLFINYLNKYINELREQGIISQFLEFRARIKTTNSALNNYEKKALDDIFGIEFICATDTEIEIVKSKIKQITCIHKEKEHNKDNGYRATHHLCSIIDELVEKLNDIAEKQGKQRKMSAEFPAIEIQYKTIQVEYQATYGTASHEKYKNTQLPELQEVYDSGLLRVGEHIPRMWVSDPNNDNMRELRVEEVLKKMYPSLILRKDTREQGKI